MIPHRHYPVESVVSARAEVYQPVVLAVPVYPGAVAAGVGLALVAPEERLPLVHCPFWKVWELDDVANHRRHHRPVQIE